MSIFDFLSQYPILKRLHQSFRVKEIIINKNTERIDIWLEQK